MNMSVIICSALVISCFSFGALYFCCTIRSPCHIATFRLMDGRFEVLPRFKKYLVFLDDDGVIQTQMKP